MNRFLSLLLALVMAAPLCAADTPPAAPVAPAVAKTESYRDAFLSFALEKAKTYSGALEGAASKAIDVAKAEAPELAREWLRWKAWEHALYEVIPLMLLGAFVALFLYNWSRFQMGGYRNGELVKGAFYHVVLSWFGVLGSAATAIALLVNLPHLFTLIQIWTAPRVYMIEQVIDLAKR